LGEGGLKPEHQVLLDEAPIQNLIGSLIQEAGSTVSKDLGSIRALRDKLPSIALADWGPVAGKEGVPEFIRAVSEAKASINNHIGSVETILRVLLSEQEEFANRFKERKEHFDSLHSAAAQQQEHLKSLIDESNRLFNELQAAESAERNAAARLTELNDAPTRLGDARNQLKAALLQRHAVLEVAAAKVEAMSGGSLKAVVRSEEVPKEYLEALISLCDGHRIRDVQTKCEERIRKAQAATVDATWESVIETSLGALRHKLQTAATSLDGTEEVGRELQGALLGALTAQQLTSLYNSLEVQKVVALASAVSESYVAFEYNDAKTYIPFSQASEGQQAAALLELLLRQDAGTLIIDQPEEDLDNRVIMHIAHLLQTTKQRRQLLFATHNPNFVVNGDADKVVVLHTGDTGAGPGVSRPRVSIEVDGAIETPPVRLAITDTIEGGREAFELRGRKYQF
jgi:predicted metal-binding protein